MDVQRLFSFLVLPAFLTACSNSAHQAGEVTSSFDSIKCQSSTAVKNEFIVQWDDGSFSLEHGDDPQSFRDDFVTKNIEHIRHVQINQRVHQLGEVSSLEVSQTAASDLWGQSKIEASSVWSQGFRGQGIKVGVVDSQVDVNHDQLQSRIAINSGEIPGNGLDDDNNGVVDDYLGAAFFTNSNSTTPNDHGTHVAGIIAADPSGGFLSGVAPEAQIIPAAFLDNTGSGTLGDAILAMQYAVSRGAKIINASWGGTGCSDSLAHAFTGLSQQGVLLVVAAGNNGSDIDVQDFYPASFNLANQITVGASDSNDLMPLWSNNGFAKVHLTAPGVSILSTGRNNSYLTMDGTSMASPFVTGAAAVLWSAKPTATAAQIKQAILRGVDVIAGKNSKTLTRGRLNLRKSLDELRRIVP